MANPRKIAVTALLKVEESGAYSNLTINHLFQSTGASPEEKRFASALFYGVLDRRITLDYILNSLTKSPMSKTAPYTAQALRTGLYQIIYMDSVPDHSAVDESVKLVRRSNESRNAGFVNAVLRNALRQSIPLPKGNSSKALSIRYSCPEWIVDSFLADYGAEDTRELLEESLKPTPLILRVNTVKITAEELIERFEREGTECRHGEIPDSVVLRQGTDISAHPLWQQGLFHVQDTASQTAAALLKPRPGERILDLCAAPGGKSFTMAQLMENKGGIISCDLHEHRTELIKTGACRLGLNIIHTRTADGRVHSPELGEFDAVLCDVPCSGYGIIRRKPDIKYKPGEDFAALQAVQRELLKTAAGYVRDGGRLLYSTCTLRRAENEQPVGEFLRQNEAFHLTYEHTYMPHKDKTDGFYCALLEKE